jgi:hypothetical protein
VGVERRKNKELDYLPRKHKALSSNPSTAKKFLKDQRALGSMELWNYGQQSRDLILHI